MLTNLKRSGLPISIKDGKLLLSKNISSLPVQKRTLGEAKGFLKNPAVKTEIKNLYLMYRSVKSKKDEPVFKKNNISYDITIINAGFIGDEFVKTIGHRHPNKPRTKITYPEIYEVIKGKALFLLQEINPAQKNSKIYLIKAGPGEKAVVPPGFGHISINIGGEPLVLANIQAMNFKSDYGFFKKHHGAGLYAVDNKKKKGDFLMEKNQNYKNNFLLRIVKSKNSFGLKIPLYKEFVKNPEKFDFLKNPEKYRKILAPKNLFKD